MRSLVVATCLVLLMGSSAVAEILFDIDPNVPDVLTAQFSMPPDIPSSRLQSTFGIQTDQGWDWTIVTLQPLPAGSFDMSQLTIAAHSSLPTKLGAQWETPTGHGTWFGPIEVLLGDLLEVPLERNQVNILHILFLSPQPGDNDLTINTLRVTGVAHIIPEPHMGASAIVTVAAIALGWLSVRRVPLLALSSSASAGSRRTLTTLVDPALLTGRFSDCNCENA